MVLLFNGTMCVGVECGLRCGLVGVLVVVLECGVPCLYQVCGLYIIAILMYCC